MRAKRGVKHVGHAAPTPKRNPKTSHVCFKCEKPTEMSAQRKDLKRRVFLCGSERCWKAYYALPPDVKKKK